MRAFQWMSLAMLLGAAAESFGKPGGTAVVQVELHARPGLLFNHRGPSRVQVAGPFAPAVSQLLARGTPLASDPDNYDTTVPPLRFEIPVPSDVRPGDYTLHVMSELYLCDESQHACFTTKPAAEVTLHVGAEGVAAPLFLELHGLGK